LQEVETGGFFVLTSSWIAEHHGKRESDIADANNCYSNVRGKSLVYASIRLYERYQATKRLIPASTEVLGVNPVHEASASISA